MNKRIFALLLAMCLLLCACGAPNEESQPQQTQETTQATEETTSAIAEGQLIPDFIAATMEKEKPDFSHIDELQPDAEGIYQIHSAQGLANMANHPDGKFKLLWDVDMEGVTWTPVGTAEAPFTGSFNGNGYVISNLNVTQAPDGYTGFFGVHAGVTERLKLENLSVAVNDGFAGALAGKNEGTLDSCTVTGMLTATGSAVAGGLVGIAESGQLTYCEAGIRMDADASATAGLLGGQLKAVTVDHCTYTGEMNLKAGQLFTNLAGAEENVTYTQCLYRDNTNSYLFLPEEARTMRDTAEQRMRALGTVAWQVDETISYIHTAATGGLHNQYYFPGETYWGVPYTGKSGSLERFLYCFNEDGTMKDFTKVLTLGADMFDMYMGVDCSGAVYWAWAGIAPSTQWMWTVNMLQADGTGGLAVGGYQGAETVSDTMQLYELNGQEAMAECYAQLRKGDACTTWYQDTVRGESQNHTRLLAQDPVILRDSQGKIDTTNSYVITHEQGDGLYNYKNSTWVINGKYTLQTMMKNYYVPITNQELLEGKQPECVVTVDNENTGKAYMTTGTVESNYRLVSATVKLKDEAGAVVWEKTLFTCVEKYYNTGTDYFARITARSFDLAAFDAYIRDAELEVGKTYTYELSAMPATGEAYILKTFDFVQ